MSINWVMISPTANPPFTALPNETLLYTSQPRVDISITSPNHYPGKQQTPFSLTHSDGTIYLTNRRLVYIPTKASDKFQSFAAPLLNFGDAHINIPWFAAHNWTASVRPVQGGHIPAPASGVVEIKMKFNEGGAHDFHAKYEQIRERLRQVADVAGIDGDSSQAGATSNLDVSNVILDDLPAYQEHSDGPLLAPTAAAVAQHQSPMLQQQASTSVDIHGNNDSRLRSATSVPDEPPPGYEEAHMAGIQDAAERRI